MMYKQATSSSVQEDFEEVGSHLCTLCSFAKYKRDWTWANTSLSQFDKTTQNITICQWSGCNSCDIQAFLYIDIGHATGGFAGCKTSLLAGLQKLPGCPSCHNNAC